MDKEARELLDEQEKEEREAAKAKADAEPVRVRVLPKGHKKIHKGTHNPLTGKSDVYHRGEHFSVGRGIAQALEDRGLGEIVADDEPAAPASKAASKAK